jgi:aspartate racemase
LRKLGLIGGMSWASTRNYYEKINLMVQRRTEPMASAPMVIESLDFRSLYGLRTPEDWARAAQVLGESARRLEQAGAGALLICANSMHRVYSEVQGQVGIPIIHIAEAVGRKMQAKGATDAVLIGTRNVMTESFYRRRLVAHGVDLMSPDMEFVEQVDAIIYDELMRGKVTRNAERTLKTIITRKEQDGAKAIVLACTELDMIVDVDANVLPIYDSTTIHCEEAVDWLLGGEG